MQASSPFFLFFFPSKSFYRLTGIQLFSHNYFFKNRIMQPSTYVYMNTSMCAYSSVYTYTALLSKRQSAKDNFSLWPDLFTTNQCNKKNMGIHDHYEAGIINPLKETERGNKNWNLTAVFMMDFLNILNQMNSKQLCAWSKKHKFIILFKINVLSQYQT